MTPEFSTASQLEKIDLLGIAHLFAIHKFDRKVAEGALRDGSTPVNRNRATFYHSPEQLPLLRTIAPRFDDDGTPARYQALRDQFQEVDLRKKKQLIAALEPMKQTAMANGNVFAALM